MLCSACRVPEYEGHPLHSLCGTDCEHLFLSPPSHRYFLFGARDMWFDVPLPFFLRDSVQVSKQ